MYIHRHQFNASHAFTKAHTAAARAAARGDIALADKWLKIAERHERLALMLFQLREIAERHELAREALIAERRRIRREGRAASDAGAYPHTSTRDSVPDPPASRAPPTA